MADSFPANTSLIIPLTMTSLMLRCLRRLLATVFPINLTRPLSCTPMRRSVTPHIIPLTLSRLLCPNIPGDLNARRRLSIIAWLVIFWISSPMRRAPFRMSGKVSALKAARSSSIHLSLFSMAKVLSEEVPDLPLITNRFNVRQYKSLKGLLKLKKNYLIRRA